MKKIAFYFFAIICFSFLFVNCEKDVVDIEGHNYANQFTEDNSLYVTSKQIPVISNLVSEKVGIALNKVTLSKSTKAELDVDYDKILKIKDSINNYSYSFKLKNEHFSNFSNIVVKKDSLGNISSPYIIQYLPNEQFKKIYNGLNFNEFSGKIKFLSIENYITNKYKTKLANLKSDPCPDNDVDMEDGISDPNNYGDADDGGEEQDDTPCRWVTKYWCPYGGRTYHPASVCGNPPGIGPGSTTILEWVCSGGGNDSDEIQYQQRIIKSNDPCDNGGGGSSNPQDNGGSIGVNTPVGDEDAAQLLYQFNQLGMQLNTEQQNWVTNNLNEAEKVLLFSQQNSSQQAINFALEAINTFMTGGEVDFEERIIIDKTLKDKPCQKGIVKQSYENKSDLANSIKQVFYSFNSGNINLTFGVKDLAATGQLGSTDPEPELISSPVIEDPNLKQWNINIYFDTDFLNQGTDLAIAATSIHEQLHALLVHANHTGVLQVTAALNPNNPTYAELMQAFAKYQETEDREALGRSQHQFMTNMVNEMTNDLLAFAQLRGINVNEDYCKTIIWGGLEETQTFKNKYPEFSPNSNIPNPEHLLIINTVNAEAKNKTVPFADHPDGNNYTVSPKGKPCN